MESRGFFISNAEARSVAKKFDKNGDGVITYGEFMSEVRPKSPARRFWKWRRNYHCLQVTNANWQTDATWETMSVSGLLKQVILYIKFVIVDQQK